MGPPDRSGLRLRFVCPELRASSDGLLAPGGRNGESIRYVEDPDGYQYLSLALPLRLPKPRDRPVSSAERGRCLADRRLHAAHVADAPSSRLGVGT